MILNLSPGIAAQTHPSLTHAIRCWEQGAYFKIHLGGLVNKTTLPRGIHRVRFWATDLATRSLGEYEIQPTAVASPRRAQVGMPAAWQAAVQAALASTTVVERV
jgi:hypothetical protein